MPDLGPDEGLAVALADMARDLLAQDTLQATLDRIAEYAVELVDGCEFAGILTVRRTARRTSPRISVRTLAATDEIVEISDRIQEEVGEGPCLDATRERHEVLRIPDVNDERERERWPKFIPRVRELGVGSAIGFLLYTSEQNLGSLNMYSRRPRALTERSERMGWLLASHAAVAFASARTDADLHASISSRTDIGQATGIMMERHKVTEDDAFAILSQASQDNNVKLRDLARRVIETGEIPTRG